MEKNILYTKVIVFSKYPEEIGAQRANCFNGLTELSEEVVSRLEVHFKITIEISDVV